MKTIKGPGIFLAQFAGDEAPYNTLEGMAKWAAGHGYVGIQIPSWDRRLFDLERAAESQTYCDELKGIAAQAGLAITEISTHLQGQLVASHPAFDTLLDAFAPPELSWKRKGADRMGSRTIVVGGQSEPQSGIGCSCNIFGRAGVAVLLSMAATAGGTNRRGIQGTGAALDADSERIRRCRSGCLFRAASGRGLARRRDFRAFSRSGR